MNSGTKFKQAIENQNFQLNKEQTNPPVVKWPKISIVTPNYNKAAFLEQTIHSVISQGYPNLQYIIIDGGSTDGSLDIIRKYETHLDYWVSEKDGGLYNAINKGFDKATGDIMAWLNSDDCYHHKSLFAVAEIFLSFQHVDWLIGSYSWFNTLGVTFKTQGVPQRWGRLDVLAGNYQWIQQESVFWRRSLWEKSGGKLDENSKYAGDFELWLRFFQHTNLFSTETLLGGFRMTGPGQISSDNIGAYTKECEGLLSRELRQLTLVELQELKRFRKYLKILKILRSIKLLDSKKIWNKILTKAFKYPPVIVFNSSTANYELRN